MPELTIDVINNKLCMKFPYRPDILEAIKTVPSRKWDKDVRGHYIGKYDLPGVIDIFQSFNYEVKYSPAAMFVMKYFIEWRHRMIALKKGEVTGAYNVDLKKPLRPFQKIGHDYLVYAQSGIVADDMGLGKTVQVLSTYKTLKEQGKARRMLVLCPSTVKGAWIKDIAKFTDLTYINIDGDYGERKEQYLVNSDIIIMSYDSYLMDFGISERRKKAEEKGSREPIPLPLGIDVCAFDECQRLVRLKNKTTQSLLILKEKLHLNYIYPMTGTPIVNRVEDLWSLMVFIDPEVLGEFWQFRSRYCEIEYEEIKMLDPKKRKMGIFEKVVRKIPHVVGYKNLDELKTKIDPYYIRREKKEVLKDLPDKTYETFELELTPDQRDMYNELKDQFFNEFKDVDVNMANALVWFIRAKQICDTAEILHPGMKDSAKMNESKDILTDLIENDNHKVVIFSQYKEMTDILVRDFSKYNPLYLHGDVKTADRQFLIDAFQEDPKYKLFISTLRAGGVGITLTAADIVILYDKWFSPAANNQAIDRVHRIGQENPVTVIDFICRDTIEERIETILERKKTMFAGIFGEDEALLGKLSSEELRSLL